MKQILILKEKKSISSAKDLFKNIQKINIDYTQENFLLFCLDTKNKVLSCEIIFKGGLNACLVCPKTLFRKALLKNSGKIIVAHNHPSNNLKPSEEDLNIYNKLKKLGDDLDLKVLDDIIFNKKEFFSMKENE